MIGAYSDLIALSFYPGKSIGDLGDAGALTTNDNIFDSRIRCLRNYGSEIRYIYEEQGNKSWLDPVQAAILRVKLLHIYKWDQWLRQIASKYSDTFALVGIGVP